MAAPASPASSQVGRRIRTVATISAASALAAVVAFVVSILSARVLGPSGRGEVATVLQFAYVVAPFVGFGADRLLLRRDDRAHGLVPSVSAMVLVAALAALVAGLVYGPWLALTGVVALVTVSFAIVRAVAISRGRIAFFVAFFAAFQGSVLLISLALYFLGVSDWRAWAAAYIFPALPLAAWALAKARALTDARAGGVIETARTNAPFIASGLGTLAATRLDRVLLPALASPASLGLYIVVATATEPLYWVAQSVADQRTSETSGQGRTQVSSASVGKRLAVTAAAYALLGGIGGAVLYVLIVPVFGSEFAPARELVAPLAVAAVLLGCYRHLCGEILGSANPRRIGVVELAAVVIAVVCYPIGILLADALGAAWASAVVYLLAGLVAAGVLLRGASRGGDSGGVSGSDGCSEKDTSTSVEGA